MKNIIDVIPTNWCDSLLTDEKGIGRPPYDCQDIERLLNGIRERIKLVASQEPQSVKPLETPSETLKSEEVR